MDKKKRHCFLALLQNSSWGKMKLLNNIVLQKTGGAADQLIKNS